MTVAEESEAAARDGDWRPLRSSESGDLSALATPFLELAGGADAPPALKEGPEAWGMDALGEALRGWGAPAEAAAAAAARGGASSIAERRAARSGFNAPRLNTARFRRNSPLSSPAAVRSPFLTIPAGLSPTALLDSPIMLANSQAQPSPTTGAFPLMSMSQECLLPVSTSSDMDMDKSENIDSTFIFKSHADPSVETQVPAASNQAQHLALPDVDQQSESQVQSQVNLDNQSELLKQANCTSDHISSLEGSGNMLVKINCTSLHSSTPCISNDRAQLEETPNGEDIGSQQYSEEDRRGIFPSMLTGRPSEDGYNWRKYGQKQVKGSEYPRSYYKCTHPTCQVKKKVERSHDGLITEIIYKGAHNHPKPQPSRRSAIGSSYSLNEMPEMSKCSGPHVKVEGAPILKNIHQGSNDKAKTEWKTDGLDTSSTSVVTDLSDPLSAAQGNQSSFLESVDTQELSSTLASHDDDDDGTTQGSITIGDDAEDDESFCKRRKKESCLIETSLASRAVREPRVVVQTDSEVDILDDGYRWRKYGQKVVKGNPNPRSYYKCTHAGCTVRKHVERVSHDLKSVITTYEGKHNHEVPAGRNGSHVSSGGGNTPVSYGQTPVALSGSANIPKLESHVHDLAPRFERKPEVNEFLQLGFIGRFAGDIRVGPSTCYDMKLPPLQPVPFSSYGHGGVGKSASVNQVDMEFPFMFPIGLHRPANLGFGGMDFNDGRPIGQTDQPFFGQQLKEVDLRFVQPKQELNEYGVYEAPLPISHLANSTLPPVNHGAVSSLSPMQHQMMGRFPI